MSKPSLDHLVRWEAFRAQMRNRRLVLGLRQQDVADLMGRSQDYVSVLENNETSIPNMITLLTWVDALGGELTVNFPEEGA